MSLLIAFVVIVLIGDLVAIGIAAIVEYFSKAVSLFVFLFLFMGFIPVAWRVAVKVTAPKDNTTPQAR